MKKINIIKKNEEFKKIIIKNKPNRNSYFLFFINKNNENNYRFGISISKKTGTATKRNKIKRQIKNILDAYKKKFKKDFDCIIIVDRRIVELTYKQIKYYLIDLINKTNLLMEETINEK